MAKRTRKSNPVPASVPSVWDSSTDVRTIEANRLASRIGTGGHYSSLGLVDDDTARMRKHDTRGFIHSPRGYVLANPVPASASSIRPKPQETPKPYTPRKIRSLAESASIAFDESGNVVPFDGRTPLGLCRSLAINPAPNPIDRIDQTRRVPTGRSSVPIVYGYNPETRKRYRRGILASLNFYDPAIRAWANGILAKRQRDKALSAIRLTTDRVDTDTGTKGPYRETPLTFPIGKQIRHTRIADGTRIPESPDIPYAAIAYLFYASRRMARTVIGGPTVDATKRPKRYNAPDTIDESTGRKVPYKAARIGQRSRFGIDSRSTTARPQWADAGWVERIIAHNQTDKVIFNEAIAQYLWLWRNAWPINGCLLDICRMAIARAGQHYRSAETPRAASRKGKDTRCQACGTRNESRKAPCASCGHVHRVKVNRTNNTVDYARFRESLGYRSNNPADIVSDRERSVQFAGIVAEVLDRMTIGQAATMREILAKDDGTSVQIGGRNRKELGKKWVRAILAEYLNQGLGDRTFIRYAAEYMMERLA